MGEREDRKMIYQVFAYLKYLLRSIHLHGIHSPFVYNFQKEIIKSKTSYYLFDDIDSIRAKLLLSEQTVNVEDFGAGSKKLKSVNRKINSIAKTAIKNKREGELLFKIVHHFKPKQILEFGTCLGISTAYLAGPTKENSVISLEGSNSLLKIAKVNLEKLQLNNIELIQGEFNKTLDQVISNVKGLDLVFFDGNHRYSPTLEYFHKCLTKVNEQSIFIFDDIYWSKEMGKAWREIKQHPSVSVTIDLYYLGIVFFKKDQKKQDFTVYHG